MGLSVPYLYYNYYVVRAGMGGWVGAAGGPVRVGSSLRRPSGGCGDPGPLAPEGGRCPHNINKPQAKRQARRVPPVLRSLSLARISALHHAGNGHAAMSSPTAAAERLTCSKVNQHGRRYTEPSCHEPRGSSPCDTPCRRLTSSQQCTGYHAKRQTCRVSGRSGTAMELRLP